MGEIFLTIEVLQQRTNDVSSQGFSIAMSHGHTVQNPDGVTE